MYIYTLNWAKRTFWGWSDKWDETALQTQSSKFELWRSEAEHATTWSRRLPMILNLREWAGKTFCFFENWQPEWVRTRDIRLSKQAASTTHWAPARAYQCGKLLLCLITCLIAKFSPISNNSYTMVVFLCCIDETIKQMASIYLTLANSGLWNYVKPADISTWLCPLLFKLSNYHF